MADYGFDEKVELKKYKGVGSGKGFYNYCSWEESVLERYRKITELKFITNLKAKLNRECRQCENYRESILSFWIPLLALMISLALTLTSAFISLKQYQDSVHNDANNAYLESLNKANVEGNILNERNVELLQNRVDQLKLSMEYVFGSFYLLYIILVVLIGIFWVNLKEKSEKIVFYKDYIIVLDKVMEEKNKDIH
ncbi:hypothetical protein [Lacrimispora sp.]|uniref:hypothetical protein n=1 Tax=Lacrimispora sp. TaxID=2719234 RepID=UPI002FD9DD88